MPGLTSAGNVGFRHCSVHDPKGFGGINLGGDAYFNGFAYVCIESTNDDDLAVITNTSKFES